MLKLVVGLGSEEMFNEATREFSYDEEVVLKLEHSLVSLSKWESFFQKPFLSGGTKTPDEVMWYIEAMTLTEDIRPEVYSSLTASHIEQINTYIAAPMTATWFTDKKSKATSREVVTAELIYYWMISFNIPFSCETWHLNRLLTLVNVCSRKNAPPSKTTREEQLAQQRELNARRKAELGTSG